VVVRACTRIAVLLFDGAPLFESAVPLSVFGIDRTGTGAPRFDVRVVAAEAEVIRSTAGVGLTAPHSLDALRRADVVIVPTWRDPDESPPPAVSSALRRAHERGSTIVGLCLGAFVVASAGLLDGRRAATHWLHTSTFRDRFPTVEIDESSLFVDLGDVVTSAGTAAGIDTCLHLVRTSHGADAANAIARRMVLAPQRAGGQAQFVEPALPDLATGDGIDATLAYAVEHLDRDLDVDALADHAHLSRRTFDRRFRAATGTSPHRWLVHQRVLHAQRLLETTDLTIDVVAREVGFGTAVSLRPHFRRIVGVSPLAYRAEFRTEQTSA
jgi:transcriptional regulator GlxA family with amidase domain